MAPRLSIVISQAPSHDVSIADVEQSIITALMFEPGMDPMLIGHLEGIQSGTTDHLCLEGIRGDFVLLGWFPQQIAYAQLARLGIYARPGILPAALQADLREEALDPVPPGSDMGVAGLGGGLGVDSSVSLPVEEQLKRRLYFVDLRSHSKRDPKTLLQGLKDLLQDRQTKTVSIKVGGKPVSGGNSAAATSLGIPTIPRSSATNTSSPDSAASKGRSHSAIPSRSEAHSSVSPMANDENDPQWQQLDKLLDDFDSLEI